SPAGGRLAAARHRWRGARKLTIGRVILAFSDSSIVGADDATRLYHCTVAARLPVDRDGDFDGLVRDEHAPSLSILFVELHDPVLFENPDIVVNDRVTPPETVREFRDAPGGVVHERFE